MNRRFLSIFTITSCIAVFASGHHGARAAEPHLDRDNRKAFAATTVSDVLSLLFPGRQAQVSSDLRLEAPFIVTPDGIASVRVTARTHSVKAIAIVTWDNKRPLNTLVRLREADGYFATRIRLERTSQVTAYVATSRGLFSASSVVKVISGASGMHPVEHGRRSSDLGKRREVTMMRARKRPGGSDVQVLVRHPMLAAAEHFASKHGTVSDHYIETLAFRLNGRLVARALLSTNIAENPLTAIGLKNTKAGDQVVAAWIDNKGHHGRAMISID